MKKIEITLTINLSRFLKGLVDLPTNHNHWDKKPKSLLLSSHLLLGFQYWRGKPDRTKNIWCMWAIKSCIKRFTISHKNIIYNTFTEVVPKSMPRMNCSCASIFALSFDGRLLKMNFICYCTFKMRKIRKNLQIAVETFF